MLCEHAAGTVDEKYAKSTPERYPIYLVQLKSFAAEIST
jgi:hypothetical protein